LNREFAANIPERDATANGVRKYSGASWNGSGTSVSMAFSYRPANRPTHRSAESPRRWSLDYEA
jgi:hypothetical protein